MSNKHKGEFEFEAGGQKYVLRFSANAVIDLEEAFGRTVGQLGDLFQDTATLKLSDIRTMFCVGLQDKHEDLTNEQRTKLFGELLPMDATRIVMQAFQRSFGIEQEAAGEANPPKPGDPTSGTGPASTQTGAA